MTDETTAKLIKQIHATLVHDTRINLHASQLELTAHGQTIVLEGTMEDIISKRIAANTAMQLAGENHVEDRLRIRTSPISSRALRDKIEKAFDHETIFRDCDIVMSAEGSNKQLRSKGVQPGQGAIEITIEDGVVTLTGQVISPSHRRLAEVMLWWIDGVQRVDNLLDIVPPRQDNDEELSEVVRLVLEKDTFVDHSQIGSSVNAGVVELTGQVVNEGQRTTVLRDVWAIPGVRDVHNHIGISA